MDIKRYSSQTSGQGEAEHFTGKVSIFPLSAPPEPARVVMAVVRFEPGAHTNWHSHPLGQTLVVMSGEGRVQRWGESVEQIHPGDVIWTGPGEKHWHGAAPEAGVTHMSVQESLDGKTADWMEQVGDEQYKGGEPG